MARLNVNPTRMELSRIKKSLITAKRGHKLLKDKRDELMRQFLDIVKEDKTLRQRVEEKLKNSSKYMTLAGAIMQKEALVSALLMPKQELSVKVSKKNVMSVDIPTFEINKRTESKTDIFSYGFVNTSADLDKAILLLFEALEDMLKLAECEKTMQLMSLEIEKTRRRVNALEYVMIPNYEDTHKYIGMKLEEADRSNITRLLKVKDMVITKRIEENK